MDIEAGKDAPLRSVWVITPSNISRWWIVLHACPCCWSWSKQPLTVLTVTSLGAGIPLLALRLPSKVANAKARADFWTPSAGINSHSSTTSEVLMGMTAIVLIAWALALSFLWADIPPVKNYSFVLGFKADLAAVLPALLVPPSLNRLEFIPYKPRPFQWFSYQSTVKVVRQFEKHVA